jgi:hypothetical protein
VSRFGKVDISCMRARPRSGCSTASTQSFDRVEPGFPQSGQCLVADGLADKRARHVADRVPDSGDAEFEHELTEDRLVERSGALGGRLVSERREPW